MSVEKIARLFEAHRSPVVGLFEDGRCAFANPALLSVLGQPPDAPLNADVFLTIPDKGPDVGPDIGSHNGGSHIGSHALISWMAAEDAGADLPSPLVLLRRADGEQLRAGARGAWVASPDGVRLFIIIMAMDAGEATGGDTGDAGGELADPLLHAINEAVIIADADRRILYANEAACRRYGYRAEEFSGLTVDAIVSPASGQPPGEIHDQLFARKTHFFENDHITRSGRVIPVEVSSRVITYRGRPAVMSVSRDISGRKALEDQLRLSEEMYRGIFTNSGIAIIILDRSDKILLGNSEAEALLASGPCGLAGRLWTEFVDDPYLLRFAEVDEVPGGFEHFRIRSHETECLTGSGERVPCLLSVSSIPGADRYIVTLQDLRENRAMVASLQGQQQLLDEIFRSAHDGFILLDEQRRVMIWNRGAERITGYGSGEMMGTLLETSPLFGKNRRLSGDALRECLVSGDDAGESRRTRTDLRILTRRGEEKDVEMAVSFVRRENGTNILCILRDVSRQKAMLDALARNEEYLRLVIDSANLCTWDWRPGEGTVAMSRRMFDILGLPCPSEPVPFGIIGGYIHPDDRARWERSMGTLAGGNPVKEPTEFRMKAADGHLVWFAGIGSIAEFNDDGSACRVVGILRDATMEKQAQQALREANRKLGILSGITRHDILNQIQGLLFYSEEIIHGDYTPAEQRMMAEKILAASETINRQISFTRMYEKLGAEPAEWQDLGALITEAKDHVPLAIPCITDVPPVEVYADNLFVEVIRGICDNIAAHATGATKVAVSFEERDGSGVLVIADDGCGIPAGKKEKIFIHNPAKPGHSLFLAQEIAGVTGIRITETGIEGAGAVFEVAFPKNGYRFAS